MKEQQAKVSRANEGLKSKAKNVREATESIPGEKVPNSNAGKKISEHITTSETMQMCNSTHCISPSIFILSTVLGPPWPPRLAMPCSAWGDLHLLSSDPASNSHLSEVLYLRTLKANIVFSSLYTVRFVGQTNDNIKLLEAGDKKKSGALFLCN